MCPHRSWPPVRRPLRADLDDVARCTNRSPAHPDAESVAAKLQRIRAVVGKAAPKAEEADFAEDLTEEAEPLVAELHSRTASPMTSMT